MCMATLELPTEVLICKRKALFQRRGLNCHPRQDDAGGVKVALVKAAASSNR